MLCFEQAPEKERKLRLMFQNVVGTLNVVAVGAGAQKGTRIQACLLSQPLQSNLCFLIVLKVTTIRNETEM